MTWSHTLSPHASKSFTSAVISLQACSPPPPHYSKRVCSQAKLLFACYDLLSHIFILNNSCSRNKKWFQHDSFKYMANINLSVQTSLGKQQLANLKLKFSVQDHQHMSSVNRWSLNLSLLAWHQHGACLWFPSNKWLGVLLLPLDRMLVHHRVTPSMNSLSH